MIKKIALLFFILTMRGNDFVISNKFYNYFVQPSKSGYYISLNIDKKDAEDGMLSLELGGNRIKEISMKNKCKCAFVINRSTGVLSYSGYRDLILSYTDSYGSCFSDKLLIFGYETNTIDIDNNSLKIDYVCHNKESLYTDQINIIDNGDCFLPQGISTYINHIFQIDCSALMIPFFTYRLFIENQEYELNLNYDVSNSVYYLNCPQIRIASKIGFIEGKLVINYTQFLNFTLRFKETFLIKNIFSTTESSGYIVQFGIYDA